METVSLKMDESLLQEIDLKIRNHRYSTRTEFIRDSIRIRLKEIEKEDAIRKLTELKGSLRGQAKMSEEEAGEIAVRKIAKKLNVELD
jgi:Arc/MetJ-type ribon-helix-helix transcriptional regulator